MKTLIIADIHNRIEEADKIVESYIDDMDQVVFLGDYFDSWDDNADMALETSRWLANVLDHPKVTCLWGNHDVAYAFPLFLESQWFGWSQLKMNRVLKEISPITEIDSPWNKLKVCHAVDGWILSHAGLTCRHFPAGLTNEIYDKVYNLLFKEEATRISISQPPAWFWSIGTRRGGRYIAGSILWADWIELVDNHVKGLKQIVGHTQTAGPVRRGNLACIDQMTKIGHAVLDSGKLILNSNL